MNAQVVTRWLGLSLVFAMTVRAQATIPYLEDFSVNAAGWRDGSGAGLADWSPAGGPDGGAHILTTLSLAGAADGDTPLVFRAQDEWASSGGAFEGDWIADGVEFLNFQVRHDAPFPLTVFVRFAGPANFPGAVAVNFVPVFPDTWTPITVAIDPANPQFVSFEGMTFDAAFSNVGHVQVGVSVGAGQSGFPLPIAVDLDKVAIVGCEPDCSGRECGDDGCGGSCGECPLGGTCDSSGMCVGAAIPAASTWGLIIMALSLAVLAKVRFGRLARG